METCKIYKAFHPLKRDMYNMWRGSWERRRGEGGGVCAIPWSNVKAKIPKRSGLQPKSFAISCAVLCYLITQARRPLHYHTKRATNLYNLYRKLSYETFARYMTKKL